MTKDAWVGGGLDDAKHICREFSTLPCLIHSFHTTQEQIMIKWTVPAALLIIAAMVYVLFFKNDPAIDQK